MPGYDGTGPMGQGAGTGGGFGPCGMGRGWSSRRPGWGAGFGARRQGGGRGRGFGGAVFLDTPSKNTEEMILERIERLERKIGASE